MPRYIVMVRSAHVSGRARDYGPYKHAALVELEDDFAGEPAMISPRARGVRRIVRDTGALYAGGKTMRSAWQRELADLRERCDRLNKSTADA